jgi:protein SCO1/2
VVVRRPSHRRSVLLTALLLIVVGLAGCGSDEAGDSATGGTEAEEAALAGVVRTPPLEVAGIELPDVAATGEPVPLQAPPGELHLVYFGYTSCPDICPTTMTDVGVALDDLPPELAERVTVGMVTVDPERDTAEVLTGYLDHFFDRRMALRTEDPAELDAAADAFGVRFEVEAHDPGATTYEVSHSAVTYVVDDTGEVVVEWPFGFDSRDMTADLTTLLQEDT